MKNFKKFLSLPDIVREEVTSIADTKDEETTPEDVWVTEARECMFPSTEFTSHWPLATYYWSLMTGYLSLVTCDDPNIFTTPWNP